MRRLTSDDLRLCVNTKQARLSLGPNLARYLLTPNAREIEKLDDPAMCPEPGCAPCMFVFSRTLFAGSTNDPFRVLSRAFVLPLVWRYEDKDTDRLPEDCRRVAQSVRDVLGIDGWSIHLPRILDEIDLSLCEWSVDSIWAPLAAGLQIAVEGGCAVPTVFATGAWDRGDIQPRSAGMVPVRNIREKTQYIVDQVAHHAKNSDVKPVFFLPEENVEDARACAGDSVEIVEISAGHGDWREALSGLLDALYAPPNIDEELDRRIRYANTYWVKKNAQKRRRYYIDTILQDLAKRIKASSGLNLSPLDRIAVMISHHFELAILMATVLMPREILFLYTDETEPHIGEIRSCFPGAQFFRIEIGSEEKVIGPAAEFLAGTSDPAKRGVDITSGTKPMTVAMVCAARTASSRMFYLDNKFDEDGLVKYGLESLREIGWGWERVQLELNQTLGGHVNSAEGTIVWTVRKELEYSVAHFTIPGGLIEPGILGRTDIPLELLSRRHLGLVISGKGPVWLYAHLVHLAHVFSWVALYDPRLSGGIVVMNHAVRGPVVGSVVPVSTPEQTGSGT